MKSFSKGKSFGGDRRGGDRFGGKKDFGGRPSFGGSKPWEKNDRGFGGDRGRADMHPAVCGECGKSCEVPFRPNGEKPVFCNDCFGGNKNDDRGSRDTRPSFDRRDRKDFGGSRSFDRKPEPAGKDYTGQFEALHTKLDRLAHAIESLVASKMPTATAQPATKAVATTKTVKAPVAKAAKKAAPAKKAVAKKTAPKKAAKKAAKKK